MTTATEPVQTETAVPFESAVEVTPTAETAPTSKGFDPEALPSEIKSYVEKQREEVQRKYADYEQHKRSSQEWESVKNDPKFQNWVKTYNTPEPKKPFELSDDEYVAALTDKRQLQGVVEKLAQRIIDEKLAPINQRSEFNEKVNELTETVSRFPDFKELDQRGLIEPVIRKYPNISFEDAYWLAKKGTLNEEADRRARGIINQKKAATVERPGQTSGGKGHRVNAKNREEAMQMVMEAARAGRPIPEFDEIGD